MAYEQYLWEEKRHFTVVCKDMNMREGRLTEGNIYTVIGMIQGMYIVKDDSGELSTQYKDRFVGTAMMEEA
jgi:hypothetical protein